MARELVTTTTVKLVTEAVNSTLANKNIINRLHPTKKLRLLGTDSCLEESSDIVFKPMNPVGSKSTPIYIAYGGIPTPINITVGDKETPALIYINKGAITVYTGSIGTEGQFIYIKDGVITATEANIGDSNDPVYLKDGVLTSCSGNYEISDDEDSEDTSTSTTLGEQVTSLEDRVSALEELFEEYDIETLVENLNSLLEIN